MLKQNVICTKKPHHNPNIKFRKVREKIYPKSNLKKNLQNSVLTVVEITL